MKFKYIFLFAVIFVFSSFVFAKESDGASEASVKKSIWTSYGGGIEEHDFIINASIGLDETVANQNVYYAPPLAASVEFIQPVGGLPFGFGGFFGFVNNGTKENGHYIIGGVSTPFSKGRAISKIYFGALANYHIGLPVKQLDLYTGPRLGVAFITEKSNENIGGIKSDSTSTWAAFHGGGVVGATWYFNSKFGVNLEVGYPDFIKIAASLKL